MNTKDIESILKKVDQHFVQGLDQSQKSDALKKFKDLYTEQLGKAAAELIKYQKVQQKLHQIEQQKKQEIQSTQRDLKKKMEVHEENRQKQRAKRIKQLHNYEEHLKMRWQQIARKRRIQQRQNRQKVQAKWKQTQQFWDKKRQQQNRSQQKSHSHAYVKNIDTTFSPSKINYYHQPLTHRQTQTQKTNLKNRSTGQFSQKSPVGISFKMDGQLATIFNEKQDPICKDDKVKQRQQKHEQQVSNKKDEHLQAYLNKLATIEQRRNIVSQKTAKAVEQAKKNRERRQNPEVIKRNIKYSRDQNYNKPSKRCYSPQRQSSLEFDKTVPFDPRKLSKTIQKHRRIKHKIDEKQAHEREENLGSKMQKIRNNKIDRLVKQAVVSLKYQALNPVI